MYLESREVRSSTRCWTATSVKIHTPHEVRENMIPRTLLRELFQPTSCETDFHKVRSDMHDGMDATPALYTLSLHEDLIARTLAYERDLKVYRLNEIEAGRGDPGRPAACNFLPLPSQSNSHRPGVRGNLTPSLLCSFSRLFQG